MNHLLRSVQIIKKMRNSVLFIIIFLFEADGRGKRIAAGICFDLTDLLNQRSDSGVQIVIFLLELVDLVDKRRILSPGMAQTGRCIIFIPIL